MIAVDSSVWIDHLNNRWTPEVDRLRHFIGDERELLVVGDLVLCEVLQGLASEREAALVEGALRKFELVAMTSPDLAIMAARNYRRLRGRGVTIRKTIDLLIGTWCIDAGLALLHSDRDFDPMARHLGLLIA